MNAMRVGFIGWRGMVGTVLLQRMLAEQDHKLCELIFFSRNSCLVPPGIASTTVYNSYDLDKLSTCDCILTTQGEEYTAVVFPQLRAAGWNGYWLDASSQLRMNDDAVIVLDPINHQQIKSALAAGVKNFIGSNCPTALMLMALAGLFNAGLIEWVSSMTYHAASGAGAEYLRELLLQNSTLAAAIAVPLASHDTSVLALDNLVQQHFQQTNYPQQHFKAPLAGSLLPAIGNYVANNRTLEEWKMAAETNKILGKPTNFFKIESTCVRVPILRCHSQAMTVKLNQDISLSKLKTILQTGHSWIKIAEDTEVIQQLTPVAVSGKLDIVVGRIKQLSFGANYISLFTVGDQLLWGAAEPLRRMLRILVST
jgi:aspartate-semialdehyde dehydrogenase